jgi:hypothetical protein
MLRELLITICRKPAVRHDNALAQIFEIVAQARKAGQQVDTDDDRLRFSEEFGDPFKLLRSARLLLSLLAARRLGQGQDQGLA